VEARRARTLAERAGVQLATTGLSDWTTAQGGGLLSTGIRGPLTGFTLAGADGIFQAARAVIKGRDTVEVSSPSVTAPQTVRYAWARNPLGANLSNKQRLPAGTFELKISDGPPAR
jgi:sialate O-acetylesterase